jgi:hypothetical protein
MMTLPDPSEYGRCPCGGTYTSRQVTVSMVSRDEPLEMSGVGQGWCPACGSRVYKAVTIELLEALMLDQPVPVPRAVPGS